MEILCFETLVSLVSVAVTRTVIILRKSILQGIQLHLNNKTALLRQKPVNTLTFQMLKSITILLIFG